MHLNDLPKANVLLPAPRSKDKMLHCQHLSDPLYSISQLLSVSVAQGNYEPD